MSVFSKKKFSRLSARKTELGPIPSLNRTVQARNWALNWFWNFLKTRKNCLGSPPLCFSQIFEKNIRGDPYVLDHFLNFGSAAHPFAHVWSRKCHVLVWSLPRKCHVLAWSLPRFLFWHVTSLPKSDDQPWVTLHI